MRHNAPLALVAALTLAACASSPSPAASVATSPGSAPGATDGRADAADLPDVLLVADRTLGRWSAGATTPRWSRAGAQASADGSAVYVVDGEGTSASLAGLDPRTGAPGRRWALPRPGAWQLAMVTADGHRVVLTDGPADRDHRRATTRLVVVDTATAATAAPDPIELPGTLEPEALSADGRQLFVLDFRPDYYRVRAVLLPGGELVDTFSRDKESLEDMHGEPVRAVASPDGGLLATLYRDANGGQPFVHVLDLRIGWTYCADLPTGSYETVVLSADGRSLYVGARDGSWVSIDVTALDEPSSDPLPLAVHRGAAPPVPLAAGGTLVSERAVVAAGHDGVGWWRNGRLVGTVERAVDGLVALAPA